MSALIVYYSLEGNTKFIAEKIKVALNADILELIPEKKYPSKGFTKYFWGGKSAAMGEEPKLINPPADLSKYDTLILGTPIWAGTFTPPLKSFMSQSKITGKKIAIFVCYRGGEKDRCFAKFKDTLKGNTIIGEMAFIEPKRKPEENAAEARKWALGLKI